MQQRYKRRNREEESLPHLATLSRQKALTAYTCAISLLSTMATSSAHAVVVGAGPSASHSLAELGKLRNRVPDHYRLKRLTLACIPNNRRSRALYSDQTARSWLCSRRRRSRLAGRPALHRVHLAVGSPSSISPKTPCRIADESNTLVAQGAHHVSVATGADMRLHGAFRMDPPLLRPKNRPALRTTRQASILGPSRSCRT